MCEVMLLENLHQAAADARQVNKESDSNKVGPDVNKKRRGRGRGSSASGKGHGSRVCDQTKMETVSLSIGQLEISRKVCLLYNDIFFKLLNGILLRGLTPRICLHILIDFSMLLLYFFGDQYNFINIDF